MTRPYTACCFGALGVVRAVPHLMAASHDSYSPEVYGASFGRLHDHVPIELRAERDEAALIPHHVHFEGTADGNNQLRRPPPYCVWLGQAPECSTEN